MRESNERDGLQQIIDEAIEDMRAEAGGTLAPEDINLAELCRRTGLTRSKARTLKAKGFKVGPHGRCGMRAETTVLTGFTGIVDNQLRKGVTNSQVIFERLRDQGYAGGLTTVKVYIQHHKDLVPAARRSVTPQGSRGQRYQTAPGEAFQMDWGFVNVESQALGSYRIACFAMVCHHCGCAYIEFFPNARQENLFIGMVHAFMEMGVPDYVLTDNMRSVVTRRDMQGRPVWQADYDAFMGCVGFKTKLCKPRHPYTKGKVERLIRFVKENFLAGREFVDITQLNEEALSWCASEAGRWRRTVACVPAHEHKSACVPACHSIDSTAGVDLYLCPKRKVTFDGFVSYEGRRFGVPWWYEAGECRVSREGHVLHIYSADLSRELICHAVTWDRRDSVCEGQWAEAEAPAELPSQPPTTTIVQTMPPAADPAFSKFDFGGRL